MSDNEDSFSENDFDADMDFNSDVEIDDDEEDAASIPEDYLSEVNKIYREALVRALVISTKKSVEPFKEAIRSTDEDGFGKVTIKKANLLLLPDGFFKIDFKSIRTLIRIHNTYI